MTQPITRFNGLLAVTLCLALALLLPVADAAEAKVTYEHESEKDFAQQLARGQVRAVTINKRVRTMRVTLTDGRHVLARYPKRQEPQTAARLKAKGVAVTVLGKAQAEKEAAEKKPTHHKIRYIAGGIVLVVIIVVGAVLLLRRRRERD